MECGCLENPLIRENIRTSYLKLMLTLNIVITYGFALDSFKIAIVDIYE